MKLIALCGSARKHGNTSRMLNQVIEGAKSVGSCELLTLTNTVQFDDYSKYVYTMSDKEEKSNRVEKISAEDLQKAFDLGVRLIKS